MGKPKEKGRSGSDDRSTVGAEWWMGRTGSVWRDIQLLLGNWNRVFKSYGDWVKVGVFIGLLEVCLEERDME